MDNYARILFLWCFFFSSTVFASDTVIRAAIDIGSGATKLRVAEVNLKTQKIERILANESYAVPYQEELEKSPTQTFNEIVMQQGIDALKKSKEVAKKYNAEKVIAIATAAFRKAKNVDYFIDRIQQETGVEVVVIDQDLEGKLSFEAASAQSDTDPTDLVVWDIGGGSIQLTSVDRHGNYTIYRGIEASVPFKNYCIGQIQLKNPEDVKTPNPMTREQIMCAEEHARDVATEVNRFFKRKIQYPNTVVIGVGNIFAYRIYPLVGNQNKFNRTTLEKAVEELENQTDEHVGGDAFANVAITNPILVLGFMKTLGIEDMQILDINGADGALLYAPFWPKHEELVPAEEEFVPTEPFELEPVVC